MTIEESLRDIRGRAALLRCAATSALWSDQPPTADARNGFETCCEEIVALATGISRTLSARVLDTDVMPSADTDE